MERCDIVTSSSIDLTGAERMLEKINLDSRWEGFAVWLLYGEDSGVVYAYIID
jgi:hypothetical protein